MRTPHTSTIFGGTGKLWVEIRAPHFLFVNTNQRHKTENPNRGQKHRKSERA